MQRRKSAQRIASMTTSIFATMSKMAVEYGAINLGQGFPDFDGPLWIMEEAFKAMKSGKNQYAPSPGINSLRKEISNYQNKFYGLNYNPDKEIIVTAGATEALYSAITAFIESGDEVILFEPYYDAYPADIILAGGTPRYVTLYKPDFHFNPEELEQAITDKTKMIIINTPHNPTGKVFSKEELEIIAKIAIKNDLLVLTDEVYEFLTYEKKHIPMATIDGMRDRTITISSTGKTFGLTGWKVGYAIASEGLANSIQKVHQWVTFAVNTPAQHAFAYAFSRLDEYLPEFKSLYLSKRNLMMNELKNTAYKGLVPYGSYFIMAEIPEGLFLNDVDAATKLCSVNKVATIPPSVFYSKSYEGNTMLRLCFAKADDTITNGIRALI